LSQYSIHHLKNLAAAYLPPLNQTYDYSQIAHYVLVNAGLVQRSILLLMGQCRLCPGIPSVAVLNALLDFAFCGFVILDAAPRGSPLAVLGFAAKWTAEIFTSCIAWMGYEKYSAMPAASQASPQAWLFPQHRPEQEIVLQHENSDFAVAIPIGPELKMFLDFYDQKPSVSLMILMYFGMLRPTRSARRVSRGRTKLFSAASRFLSLLGK
jgi:hypothetical protein